jgi:predicted aldo/keto reductase-like oxidoreductase
MLFFVDSEKEFSDVFEGDALSYAIDLKKKGHVRAIGASSHNPVTARKIVETGHIELLMFNINPAFDMASADVDVHDYVKNVHMDFEKNLDPDRAALYRLCEQRGVAITVMKTLAGGKLLSPEYTPFARPLTLNQCIHYALTRPAVVSALLGCYTQEHVLEAVSYLNAGEKERDYTDVIKDYQGNLRGSCMYCNHCLPCPSEIDIAAVTRCLDIAALDEKDIPPQVISNYRTLEHRASECAACGNCEKRCPFSVPVVQNMKKAAALFGT